MAEPRIPEIPLPRPFLRVVNEAPVTKEDLERVRKSMQQTIDNLQAELKREQELNKKLLKSAEVLQEILSAPDFKALSLKSHPATEVATTETPGMAQIDEPPVEYVEVQEIELTDTEVKKMESSDPARKKEDDD